MWIGVYLSNFCMKMKKFYFVRLVLGLVLLVLIFEVCDFFVKFLGIKFPSSLIAMMLLYLLLHSKILPLWTVEDACKKMLEYMPICFVPVCVGIASYKSIFAGKLIPLFTTLFLSCLITILFTASSVEFVKFLRRRFFSKDAKALENAEDRGGRNV